MDPTANLNEQRALRRKIRNEHAKEHSDLELLADYAVQLEELVDALDAWIVGGGFLPTTWARS